MRRNLYASRQLEELASQKKIMFNRMDWVRLQFNHGAACQGENALQAAARLKRRQGKQIVDDPVPTSQLVVHSLAIKTVRAALFSGPK